MYHPEHILSSNTKTGRSINLPIKGHCTPTPNCSRTCYAKHGHCARPCSTRKQVWVSSYLKGPDITELTKECQKHPAIRLSATGDLLLDHVPNILSLARSCPKTQFWGMTRKINIAQAINNHLPNLRLLVSIDSSSPPSVWNYPDAMCWGPRLPNDTIPEDDRIKVVFPYHAHGKVIKAVPHHPKDCQAVWHSIDGCLSCGRCWKW